MKEVLFNQSNQKILKPKFFKSLILIFLAIILLFGIVWSSLWLVSYFKWPSFVYNQFFTEKPIKLWAIYLTVGGQTTTYYGEIIKWENDYLVLKDLAYIDVRQNPNATSGESIVTFRKLTDEFYRPKLETRIFKKNIIFIQELSSDSPIYDAYKQASISAK